MAAIRGDRLKILQHLSDHGETHAGKMLELDPSLPSNNLHKTMQRMEAKGWLSSRVKKIKGERNRPRRFYTLTPLGHAALEFALQEQDVRKAIQDLGKNISRPRSETRFKVLTEKGKHHVRLPRPMQDVGRNDQPSNEPLPSRNDDANPILMSGSLIYGIPGLSMTVQFESSYAGEYDDLMFDFFDRLKQRRAEIEADTDLDKPKHAQQTIKTGRPN